MIELSTNQGLKIHINPDHIVSIHEASLSSRWHGTGAIIRTVVGDTHEVREEASQIFAMIAERIG